MVDYLVPGTSPLEQTFKKCFWDDIYKDVLTENKYEKLCAVLEELRDVTLDFIPSRTDLQNEFKEHVDIPFLKQQFENCVFSHEDFVKLFSYWVDWAKKLGMPSDDKKMDDFLEKITTTAEEKGYLYILPFAYNELHDHLTKLLVITNEMKMKLKNTTAMK